MKHYLWLLFLIIIFFFKTTLSFAESSHILPYPSSMPGSKFYQIRLIWDEVKKYWYFGNFGQFVYNLKQSDKYLVETKTLFEYKQYLLGIQALKKSDKHFSNILQYLIKAKEENKNITQKQNLLKEAGLKHIEVLNSIKEQAPESFVWRPEKLSPTILNLKKSIEESVRVRNKYSELIIEISYSSSERA